MRERERVHCFCPPPLPTLEWAWPNERKGKGGEIETNYNSVAPNCILPEQRGEIIHVVRTFFCHPPFLSHPKRGAEIESFTTVCVKSVFPEGTIENWQTNRTVRRWEGKRGNRFLLHWTIWGFWSLAVANHVHKRKFSKMITCPDILAGNKLWFHLGTL